MLSVEEARGRILADARLTDPETVALHDAAGRVPASFEVVAAVDVPPFANSACSSSSPRSAFTTGLRGDTPNGCVRTAG